MHLFEGPDFGHYWFIMRWEWKGKKKKKAQHLAGFKLKSSWVSAAEACARPLSYNRCPQIKLIEIFSGHCQASNPSSPTRGTGPRRAWSTSTTRSAASRPGSSSMPRESGTWLVKIVLAAVSGKAKMKPVTISLGLFTLWSNLLVLLAWL